MGTLFPKYGMMMTTTLRAGVWFSGPPSFHTCNYYTYISAYENNRVISAPFPDCCQKYSFCFSGTFTCLEIAFELHRDAGYYVMVVFIPSIVIVAMSWVQVMNVTVIK